MGKEYTTEKETAIRIKVKFVKSWSALAGLIHILAALLLVGSCVVPGKLPNLVQVALGTSAVWTTILTWICAVLVGGIGLTYLSVVVGSGRTGQTVWIATALLHGLVAVFLIWQIETGVLPSTWLLWVMSGLVVGVVQMTVVRAGWWSSVRKWQLHHGRRGSPNDR